MTEPLSPDEERRVVEGIEQSDRGEVVAMSDAEVHEYARTGVLPARVTKWAGSST
jgi:hypothetical protein